MISMNSITDSIDELRPLPATLVRFTALVNDDNSSIDEYINVLKLDQAVSTNILKLANSASSASGIKIKDIKSAVVRLGGKRILVNLLNKYLSNDMSGEIPLYGYGESNLWRHSMASAFAAEIIATKLNIQDRSFLFMSGLLHDIGKLLIFRNVSQIDSQKIIAEVKESGCFVEIEKKILGFTHCEIGSELLSRWNIPEEIIECVREHHNSDSNSVNVKIIKLANYASKIIGEGVGNEGMQFKIGSKIFDELNLSIKEFETICAEVSFSFIKALEDIDK